MTPAAPMVAPPMCPSLLVSLFNTETTSERQSVVISYAVWHKDLTPVYKSN